MGARLYNHLPTSARTAENEKKFMETLDSFLKKNNLKFKCCFLNIKFHKSYLF